jgi:methionyl-tRNA formyltransferase
MKNNLKLIFMGTPEFAVPSLKIIHDVGFNILAVVTAPDKPAGRGLKLRHSPVKRFAVEHQIPVLQPEKLKHPDFLHYLESLKTDLQVVVAFRLLPEIVWNMPLLGTINLHASLLPDYRGAAPINWALINGEKITGVTTFFLKHEVDTGDIILQHKINIEDSDNAGTLHDKLSRAGAGLLLQTVNLIEDGNYKTTPQNKISDKIA